MGPTLRGTTIVITGASSGIGAAAARRLAELGAQVVPIGRTPGKTAAIGRELGVDAIVADYAELAQVRRLAAELARRCDRIDVLVHNAGGMNPTRIVTVDGHEATLQGNYLGPFLLHALLAEQLAASRTRTIATTSLAHHLGRVRPARLGDAGPRYSAARAYADSKLADLLFARQLARRGGVAVGFDPGLVATDFLRTATGEARTIEQHPVRARLLGVVAPEVAAAGIVRFATMAEPERISGRLISRRSSWVVSSPASRSAALGEALWRATEELVG